MYLLETQSDWSWISQMGEIALAIVGCIAIAIMFIKKGLPKVLEYKLQKTQAIGAGVLEDIKGWLNRIENTMNDEAQKRMKRQIEVDERLDQLEEVIIANKTFSEKISQGTLEAMLFNEELAVSRRLSSFRKLIAMGKNGRVKEKGYKLILNNKEVWKDVESTELNVEIINSEYYQATMEKANKLAFDISV